MKEKFLSLTGKMLVKTKKNCRYKIGRDALNLASNIDFEFFRIIMTVHISRPLDRLIIIVVGERSEVVTQ